MQFLKTISRPAIPELAVHVAFKAIARAYLLPYETRTIYCLLYRADFSSLFVKHFRLIKCPPPIARNHKPVQISETCRLFCRSVRLRCFHKSRFAKLPQEPKVAVMHARLQLVANFRSTQYKGAALVAADKFSCQTAVLSCSKGSIHAVLKSLTSTDSHLKILESASASSRF